MAAAAAKIAADDVGGGAMADHVADIKGRVRVLVTEGYAEGIANVAVKNFAPEVLGFLTGAIVNDADVAAR